MPEKDILVSAIYIQINAPIVQITSPIENSVYSTSDVIGVNIDASSALGKNWESPTLYKWNFGFYFLRVALQIWYGKIIWLVLIP